MAACFSPISVKGWLVYHWLEQVTNYRRSQSREVRTYHTLYPHISGNTEEEKAERLEELENGEIGEKQCLQDDCTHEQP